MKKFNTPSLKVIAMETTASLNQTLNKTLIDSFEYMAILATKGILDSYEWLLYASGKTYDVYTITTIQFEFESAIKYAKKVICKVEMNDFANSTESINRASKGFTVGNLLLHLNYLKSLIERTERINDAAKHQCEKAWHEYENGMYWLHFLKKKVHETT